MNEISVCPQGSLPPAESGLVIKEQVGAVCEAPNRPYLVAQDDATGRAIVFRPDCKCWKCAHCAEVNRMKWCYKIKKGIEQYENEGDKFWFITLTTNRKIKSFDVALGVWRHAWDKLYHRMKRYSPKKLHYVLLPELAPKTGRLHAHMIINCSFGAEFAGLNQKGEDKYKCRWMKDNPAKVGLGYMNDVRPVNNAGLASWYVAKYVGKSLGVVDWPEHLRRVRVSIDWPEQEPIGEDVSGLKFIAVMPHKFYASVENLWSQGYDVINLKTGEIVEIVDFKRGYCTW